MGFIESEVFEMEIKIQKGDQAAGEFTNNMERPVFFLSEDSQMNLDFSQFEEEIVQNNNFVSWHDNHSTPRE